MVSIIIHQSQISIHNCLVHRTKHQPNVQIENGQFSSASEAIRAGLRLLEEKDIKLAALRRALEDGENSGYAEYSLTGLLKELDKESSS